MGNLKTQLRQLKNDQQKQVLQRFFKTGKGEYGEGDIFWGINVPETRRIIKGYYDLKLDEIEMFLKDDVHELRLAALLILVEKYKQGDLKEREKIVKLYLKNTKYINNWDLVDLSAPKILGLYLLENKNKRILLKKMVKSKLLWDRRIAVLATYPLVKSGEFRELKFLAKFLLNDREDLIHKATGWMLREMGKIKQKELELFVWRLKDKMPRTMLRYAIERLEQKKRMKILGKN